MGKQQPQLSAPNLLLGLPLVSALAFYQDWQEAQPNKVTQGVANFLEIVQDTFPELLGDEARIRETVPAAKDLLQRLEPFVGIREELKEGPPKVGLLSLLEQRVNFEMDTIPQPLWGGLLVPLLGTIQTEAEKAGTTAEESITARPAGEDATGIQRFLEQTGVIKKGGLGRNGRFLLGRIALGGYTQLAYSYLPYFLKLDEVLSDPSKAGLGKPIDRLQPENAQASNQLISNILGPLARETLTEAVARALDFGSGGGYFLMGMAREGVQVVGMDINKSAISSSRALFKGAGIEGSFYLGDLIKQEDLAQIAAERLPDIAFINYILHDIAGIGETREAGLEIVKEFLRAYRQFFAGIPLYISETYYASPEQLRADGNAGAIVFAFLHAVSPQYLLERKELLGLLEAAGFEVRGEVIHRTHEDGAPANSTLMAVPG